MLYAKRQAEKFERLEKHSLDEDNTKKYGIRKRAWNALQQDSAVMKLSIPEDVYQESEMSDSVRYKINSAIKVLESQYNIYIDSIEGAHMGGHDIFVTGAYTDDYGMLKYGMVLNYDIDYQKVEQLMQVRYNENIFAGRTFEDYIAHEVAHILPFQNCINQDEYMVLREQLRKEFVPGISRYADRKKDGAESLAEAFVRYRNGENIPDESKALIKKYITPWRR